MTSSKPGSNENTLDPFFKFAIKIPVHLYDFLAGGFFGGAIEKIFNVLEESRELSLCNTAIRLLASITAIIASLLFFLIARNWGEIFDIHHENWRRLRNRMVERGEDESNIAETVYNQKKKDSGVKLGLIAKLFIWALLLIIISLILSSFGKHDFSVFISICYSKNSICNTNIEPGQVDYPTPTLSDTPTSIPHTLTITPPIENYPKPTVCIQRTPIPDDNNDSDHPIFNQEFRSNTPLPR